MPLAPIVLFVYNRPWHTQQTIEALQKNEFSEQSDLIIYSDAPRNDQACLKVQEVRDYLKRVDGFKTVKVIERKENRGLAKSIITGVTEVVNHYGKIIVLEDDIVTSPAFLSFMNQALDFFQSEHKVWHISGWNYPINSEGLEDIFFWRVMNCWGWATWADRWQYFEKNPNKLMQTWSKQQKHNFDLEGSGVFWHQVTSNAKGKMNTWAIFWYATIYNNNGFCLNPTVTYVENVGHDGTGVHCGKMQAGKSHITALNVKEQFDWPLEIKEVEETTQLIKQFYKKQKKFFLVRIINKLARFTIGKNIL
jgi:glycosyltransferase involved in cell wall biosynthesis